MIKSRYVIIIDPGVECCDHGIGKDLVIEEYEGTDINDHVKNILKEYNFKDPNVEKIRIDNIKVYQCVSVTEITGLAKAHADEYKKTEELRKMENDRKLFEELKKKFQDTW